MYLLSSLGESESTSCAHVSTTRVILPPDDEELPISSVVPGGAGIEALNVPSNAGDADPVDEVSSVAECTSWW